MDHFTDRDIVNRFIQSRSEDLFRLLYNRHAPRLYLFSLRLASGDRHQAEDVVQETWIRAVQKLHTFEWRSSLSSWLSGIALNCYRELRGRQHEKHPLPGEIPSANENPGQTLDLEMLIRRLPNGCREIFVLHDIEGYTHEEIARVLDIGNGTSKSQLFEARKKLRQWLTEKNIRNREEDDNDR